MKKWFFLFLAMIFFLNISCGQTQKLDFPALIFDHTGENRVELPELIDYAAGSDIVFIGEIHDDSLTHVLEEILLRKISAQRPLFAVALEMFERDVQSVLDDYLTDKITEEHFLENSRPWNNYAAGYKPLVEYAKKKNMPVLAMNIPRRYAAQVARHGEKALENWSDSEKNWIASELKAFEGDYKERFMNVMVGRQAHPMAQINTENLYKAQCIKDDTMAESIAGFIKENRDHIVISYQGDFHSAFFLGIPEKLQILMPDLNMCVISIVPVEDIEKYAFSKETGRGDFIIGLPRIQQTME